MLRIIGALILALVLMGCAQQSSNENIKADMVLENGNIYSFSWGEPSVEGVPASDAPFLDGTWSADAEAIAIKDGMIIAVGSSDDMAAYKGAATEVLDVKGAYIYPGFVDTHTHIEELGATLDDVNLKGVESEEEAVQRVVDLRLMMLI